MSLPRWNRTPVLQYRAMVVSSAHKYGLLVAMFILCLSANAQQGNLLQRKVRLQTEALPPQDVLMKLSDKAGFTFSYDASIFSDPAGVAVNLNNQSVKVALDEILPQNITYKVSGNHLILLKKTDYAESGKRQKYVISGSVHSAFNNEPLEEVLVYEVSSLVSAVTDSRGRFTMSVPAQFAQLGLSFNKITVEDTILIIPPKDQDLIISLRSVRNVTPAHAIKTLQFEQNPTLESMSLVQKFVPVQSMSRVKNADLVINKVGQVSFLPTWGSNLKMSGLVENKFSLNVLVGYAYGTSAFEVGGAFNIIRNDVKGMQVAGAGNLVGGSTRGVQVAGVFNHNKGALVGFQISGVNNMLIDSLKGVQVAGVNNILKGKMKGIQIAGVNNLTTQNVDGLQLAGVTNIARLDVSKVQIAGLLNKGNNVDGVQVAGLMNLAKGKITGIQIAGLLNKASNVNAIQFAGIGNISRDTVSGAQVAGLFNHARYIKSSQIGLINVSDSASGVPIGLLSYVKKGFRAIELSSDEISPGNVVFKTGVKKLYNIFSFGYGSWNGSKVWSFGYGLGSQKSLSEKFQMGFEYNSKWVNEQDAFQKDLNSLHRINFDFGLRTNKLVFSAGPSINVWLSEWKNKDTNEYLTRLAPYTIFEKEIGTTQLQMWIGGRFAIQFQLH